MVKDGGALRVFKSEVNELFKTGRFYFVAVIVLLSIFMYFAVIMPTIVDTFDLERQSVTEETRVSRTAYYQSRIAILDAKAADSEKTYTEDDRVTHEQYKFYVQTNTIENDYFMVDNLYANYRSNRGAVNMLFTADSAHVILMLLALLIAFLLFFRGLKSTKDVYGEAGISGKSVMTGKLILAQIILNLAALALFAVGLIFGGATSAVSLMYLNGWTTFSPIAVYIARMIGAYIMMQLMLFGALASAELFKSKPFGLLVPVVVYLFALSLSMMLVGLPFAGNAALAFIPFLSLQFAVAMPWLWTFILSALLHLAALAGLVFLLYTLIKRRRGSQPPLSSEQPLGGEPPRAR